MKAFHCVCGNGLFFENTECIACHRRIGFDPNYGVLLTLEPDEEGGWRPLTPDVNAVMRLCRNYEEHGVCNWVTPVNAGESFCLSCRLNRTIPNLSNPKNLDRWRALEAAKRRLLYTLLRLGLPVAEGGPHGDPPMAFDFLEDQRSNPDVLEEHVLTGHTIGLITLNVAEADDDYREQVRVTMNESYRTLLGHFRHESGHHYWQRLINESAQLPEFRALFGDERRDYDLALREYHARGPQLGWPESYISAYACAHPLEDWAECWAHYLHMVDTLETAEARGVLSGGGLEGGFDKLLQEWSSLTIILNELNRSMGLRDAYPFVLSAPVIQKLHFIHDRISAGESSTPSGAAR